MNVPTNKTQSCKRFGVYLGVKLLVTSEPRQNSNFSGNIQARLEGVDVDTFGRTTINCGVVFLFPYTFIIYKFIYIYILSRKLPYMLLIGIEKISLNTHLVIRAKNQQRFI